MPKSARKAEPKATPKKAAPKRKRTPKPAPPVRRYMCKALTRNGAVACRIVYASSLELAREEGLLRILQSTSIVDCYESPSV